ncbi:MAG: hypothetical protein Q9218_006345 [Villophora microphyllina]
MAITESPWRSAKDSPSRQLLWELSQLSIIRQEDLYEQLDRESEERDAIYKHANAIANARHEQVRKEAEAEKDRLEQEQERKEAEARLEEERKHQARAEQEKVEKRHAAERAETAARAERAATQEREAEQARQKIEKDRQEAQAAKLKKEAQEAEARTKAEAERKSKEAAVAAIARSSQRAQSTVATLSKPNASASTAPVRSAERESEHQRYVEIHKTLKEMRRSMTQQAKQDPKLKSRMGDMRREIKKSIGQLREGKGVNAIPQSSIQKSLKEAINSFPQPTISAARFTTYPNQDTQVPALLIFLLNHLSKAVISQLIKEAAVAPKIADPIGTIAVSIFANNDFRVNGNSLIDILIAKMHVVCPPLFGIYGPDNSDEGRTRLGWWREVPGGPWINDQTHQDRMTGLGAGYAALTLRNFEKAKATNPYPPYHFWRAITAILNVPAGHVTETHLVLLKALLTNSEARFMEFFGEPAKKILQFAIKEYPKRAPKGSVAAAVLSNLGDTLKKDKKLYL